MTTTTKHWNRVLPGLYVDGTETWVLTQDGNRYWTVRAFEGWGEYPEWSAKRGELFPDYGDIIYGNYATLNEAKRGAEQLGDAP